MTTQKRKTLSARASLLAVVALAACVLLSAGVASARYFQDGSVQNGTTGGWNLPTDFVCIKGVQMDGTLNVVAGVTSRRVCNYYTSGLTGMNPVDVTLTSSCGSGGTLSCASSTNCKGTSVVTLGTLTWNATDSKCYDSAPCTVASFAGATLPAGAGTVTLPANTGGKHSLTTSICTDGFGNGNPLTGLDQTAQMCVAKGGIWKQTSATAPVGVPGIFPTAGFGGACVAYGAQFKGQDSKGTPLAFGTKGTVQAAATCSDVSKTTEDSCVAAGAIWTPATGFCYTPMNMNSAFTTPATDCPSNKATTAPFDANAAYDWSYGPSSSRDTRCQAGQCCYAKAIAGILPAVLGKADGTTYPVGFLDMSTFTTMGDCLANGGSWNNWTGQAPSTTTVATSPLSTIPVWDYQTQAPDADNGCLHCHSTTVEYNGPAERFKSSYLMTGHKNMLRKVTAGQKWAGPDANGVLQIYKNICVGGTNDGNGCAVAGDCPLGTCAGYAAGLLDFGTASPLVQPTATVSGVPKPLLYIFGDWMAPAPAGLDVIVNIGGAAKYNGVNNYSCAPCHSTGWSDNGTAAASRIGLCVPSSGGTNQAACTGAGGTWYPAIGVKGIGNSTYTPQEPAASFPGITFGGAGQWDVEGILCSRCHNAAVGPVTSQMITASAYKTTYPTGGGMGNIPSGVAAAGTYGTFVCYGCHQQIAKNNNGVGANDDLAHPENIPVANSVTTGMCSDGVTTSTESTCQAGGGIWTPTAYIPTAPGGKHVLGGEFLNSAHQEATVNIVPNSLGKYDLNIISNSLCTAAATPFACCTGAGAGTCSGNSVCTAAGVPLACCTGAGTGTCPSLTYGSTFRGYTCWQGNGSSSPALTWIDNTITTIAGCDAAEGEWESVGCVREIKDKTTCENLYGAGAWAAASNGSCVTCHDVHNSLFVAGQEEKALRKTCQNCHVDNATTNATVGSNVNTLCTAAGVPWTCCTGSTTGTCQGAPQISIAGINHLHGSGTPFDTSMGESPCVVCHMPKPTSGDFPMHLWRINTKANYSTFPSAAQYGAGTVPTKKIMNASADGAYANAVWVDLDLACGQCHGGGDAEDAQHLSMVEKCTGVGTPYACCNGAGTGSCGNYRTKEELAAVAVTMHDGGGVTYPTTFSASPSGLTVAVSASVTCNGPCSFTYDWDWGDGSTHGTGATSSHDYATTANSLCTASGVPFVCCSGAGTGTCTGAGTKSITLTVMENGGNVGTAMRSVTLYAPTPTPVPGGLGAGCPNTSGTPTPNTLSFDTNSWTASFTDSSTPAGSQVVVDWGDGTRDFKATGMAFSHKYAAAGSYLIVQKVITKSLQMAIAPGCALTAGSFTIDGHIYKSDGVTPLGAAVVSVKSATTGNTVKTVYTKADGSFTVGSLKPDTYWLVVSKAGYTFPAPTQTGNLPITVGGNAPGISISAKP